MNSFHNKKQAEKGIVLVGTVGLLVFLGLFTAVATSILNTTESSHVNRVYGTQALALAHAGAEWYLEQLENDTDWSDEGAQTLNFAEGQFSIAVDAASAASVTFTVTGSIVSPQDGYTFQRVLTLTAEKIPKAFQFALFQAVDTGTRLDINNNGANATTITGDVWSRGDVRVNSPNSVVGGLVYAADTQTVFGTGTYTGSPVAAPYPAMPSLDPAPYRNVMDGFDTLLDANNDNTSRTVNNSTFDINTSGDCTAGLCEFRNFETTGDVTITGNGTISVNRDIDLHSANGQNSSDHLTISPDPGGSISIICNRTLIIGSNNDPHVTVESGVTFYSRSNNNNRLLRVRGSNTAMDSSSLYSRRRIIVERGSDITGDALLFVDDAGNSNNNYLDIIGQNGVTTVEGLVISLGANATTLRIRNGGSSKTDTVVRGIVYGPGDSAARQCLVQDAVIRGTLVCHRFQNNRVRNISLTHSTGVFPDPLPEGFDGSVAVRSGSYDIL